MMFAKLLLVVFALAADGATNSSTADSAAAEAPTYKVGSEVIVIHETPLRIDDYPEKQLEPGTPLRVEEVNSDGFLGVTAGKAGWVDPSDVVAADKALQPLTQLLSQDADNVRLHQARVVIASSKKNWDLAIEDLTALMRLEPDATKYYLLRGDVWLKKHDTDKALDDLNEAVRREENPAYALLKRGYLWAEKKDYDKALADFNDALGRDLDGGMKAEILAYRGGIYMDQKQVEKAFADFNEALRLNPRDASNFVMRGSANYHRQKYKDAITDYSAALWLEPNSPSIYSDRAYAFWRNGESKAAQADFEKAIQLDPENSRALIGRGTLRAENKEFNDALVDFNESLRLDPNDIESLMGRANTYGMMKEYDKQIADYREAIKIAPDDSMAHNNLAWILATCPQQQYRDGQQSVQEANKAVELTQNKQGEFIDTLAAAYAEAGDFDKAAENQQKAIELVDSEKVRKEMRARLELFHKHEAYRETPGENAVAGD